MHLLNLINMYVGIDPGKHTGRMAAISPGGCVIDWIEMPLLGNEYSLVGIKNWLILINPICVGIEHVHNLRGVKASSNSTLLECMNICRGICEGLGYKTLLPTPKKWQAEMEKDMPIIYKLSKSGRKQRDTKEMSKACFHKLYPSESLLRTKRCTKEDDNISDAVLIAEYTRRKCLGLCS